MLSFLPLFIFILLVVCAASTGAIFKPGAWYLSLDKPFWTPPSWAFPVVWSVLYILIIIAAWLVWQAGGWSLAIVFWGLQIIFNVAWSWIFFGRRQMGLALADIGLLWLSIVGFMIATWPISQTASWLFIPYLIWVSVAAALNLSIWQRNRVGGLG